jgi:hypothetical protein
VPKPHADSTSSPASTSSSPVTALVDAVVSLLQDPARWRVLSENGRALIRARYMPDVAFRALDEVLVHVPRRN